jgi:SWI/SNF-related matrix-associated actin-dependent regulator 1 of chromatin subfamily A
MQTLDPYQEEGARFLATKRKAFLGDEPGEVGKTLQAIRACDMVGARRVLVVCPPSVKVNWRRYFADSSLLDPELEIYTHATLDGAWLKDRYDVVIADEAHYYKNPKSKRTKLFYGEEIDGGDDSVVGRGKHVFLLSGSPAPNNPGELWTHLHALRPDLIQGPKGAYPAHRFTTLFCNVRMTPFGPKVEGVRQSKIGRLKEILDQFMLRREKGFFTLPDLTVEPLFVEPGISLKDASEDMAAVAEALADGGLDALRGLSTSHPNLRRLLGLAKIKPTIAYVEEWLDANLDSKICVYAWHSEVVDRIRDHFAGMVASIDGSTRNRQGEVDRFQDDPTCRVFVGQMTAAGEAITLTRATETLLVEPSWVPKDNRQTIKRIHRRGQTRPCLARFVTVVGSVDEDINRALRKKEAMLDAVFGEVV